MTRLKRILTAAAAIVTAGGVALGLALFQANQADPQSLTCAEWTAHLTRASQQQSITFFVAIQQGYNPPAASSAYILGDCAGGTCTVKGNGCDSELTYAYISGALVNGWRMIRVQSPRYFALGYKQLASESASVRFYRSYKDAAVDCLAHFTPVQCRNLFVGVADCWKRLDGQYCRYGLLYGPGVGGVNADGSPATCVVGATDVPFPCSDEGRGQAWAAGAPAEVWPDDADLELPE